MKSISLLLLLLWFVVLDLNGQDNSTKADLGLSFVPMVCHLSNGDNIGKSKANFGFGLEAAMSNKIKNKFGWEAGIHFQQTRFSQKYNENQWPSDVKDGQFVPGLSYEQFDATVTALGVFGGYKLKLSEKENGFSLTLGGAVNHVLSFKDDLVINESGHFTEFDSIALHNSVKKFQVFARTGLFYNLKGKEKSRFSIGFTLEYSILDLLASSERNLLWSYGGGHPLLTGLSLTYKI